MTIPESKRCQMNTISDGKPCTRPAKFLVIFPGEEMEVCGMHGRWWRVRGRIVRRRRATPEQTG